jgi:two-component system sensor histidine kinase YesM
MMNSAAKLPRTIRQDLLLLLMTVILAPFAIITILYTYNVKTIIDTDVKSYQEAIIKQSGSNINNIFSSIKMIQRTTLGKVISDYVPINHNSSLDKNDIEKLKDLIEFLTITEDASSYVNGIYVIFESGYTISSRNGIRENLLLEKEWINNVKILESTEIITGFHDAEYNVSSPRAEYDIVMSFVQEFVLPEQNGAKVIVQIDIEKSAYNTFIGSKDNTEQIPMYLLDLTNEKILVQNENYQTYIDHRDKNEIVITEEIKKEHLLLYAFIRKDQIIDRFNSSILSMTLIITLIVVISVITAIVFSRAITAPLHELYLCMKKVGKGDFSPIYPRTNYNEVSYLIGRFETMVKEVDDLVTTVSKQESETQEAKFQALQAKINPHFLYNTLDVIRSIALTHKHKDISDMTLSLSRLFRYNVGDLKETNSLGTEIEYIKDYLKIQEYRFGDRISTIIDIKDKYKDIQITRFILQPIIENAFKYGLELRGKGGILKISAVKDGEVLIISIFDNGPGVSTEILEKLKHSFSIEPDIKSVTMAHGLDNVNLRMKLLYGDKYGLKIDSLSGEWTRLDILIPFKMEK